jgi:superfamily II DNA or RNA helicase
MVTLKRISTFRAKIICNNSSEMNYVKRCLSFFQESAYMSALYVDGIWDGFHRFYDKEYEIDFGLAKYITDEMEKQNITVKTVDYDKFSFKVDLQKVNLNPMLWQHQKDTVIEFFKNPFGIAQIPTRGGKTFTSAEISRICIEQFDSKVLFIVDSVDLQRQTKKEFELFLNDKVSRVGTVQGKILDFSKQITVATIQTLTGILFPVKTSIYKKKKENFKRKKELTAWLKTIDLLIVDEVHEFLSVKRIATIKTCDNIRGLLCLSATPYKSESFENSLKLRGYTGDLFYKVEESLLQERGVLSLDEVFLILFESHEEKLLEENSNAGSEFMRNFEDFIIFDKNRNNLLLWLLEVLKSLNLKTLVLFTRKEHGNLISSLTGYDFLSGDDKSPKRTEIKDEFLLGEGKTLLASNIFKKGISLNSCQVLININSGLEKSDIVQKRGRVLASSEGKTKSLIIDIIDNINYFSKHSLSRLEAYEMTSEGRISIFDYADSDFKKDFIESLNKCFDVR